MQTTSFTSSTPKPACASAMSSIRSRPRPPTPVSNSTIPAPRCIAQAFPCGTPGHGQGSFSRQIPGWIRSVRGFTTRASAIRESSQLAPSASRVGAPRARDARGLGESGRLSGTWLAVTVAETAGVWKGEEDVVRGTGGIRHTKLRRPPTSELPVS